MIGDGWPKRGSAEYQLGYHAGYQRGRADAANGWRWPWPTKTVEDLQAENDRLRKRIAELEEKR